MAQLQLSAEKFDELTDCPICLKAYIHPQALPCQHYLCLLCAERVLERERPQCPICRQSFTDDQLNHFTFYSQLQGVTQRIGDMPMECGVCSQCERQVRDKYKDLRPGTKFEGNICADCAATERLIVSIMSSKDQEGTVDMPVQSAVCSECGGWVGDKDRDLRSGTTFRGNICVDCAATEEIIKSMEPSTTKDEEQEGGDFCLDLTCPGPPCCTKLHLASLAI